jgi:hypothetical protein
MSSPNPFNAQTAAFYYPVEWGYVPSFLNHGEGTMKYSFGKKQS